VKVHALGGTIVYTVNQSQLNTTDYELEVLTVVESLKPKDEELISRVSRY
jgi:hypothetical protein